MKVSPPRSGDSISLLQDATGKARLCICKIDKKPVLDHSLIVEETPSLDCEYSVPPISAFPYRSHELAVPYRLRSLDQG